MVHLQNESDKRQLGLFFFNKSDAQALVDKVSVATAFMLQFWATRFLASSTFCLSDT